MHLIALGISHVSAPVELRERVAIADRALPSALAALRETPAVMEAAILSTCNRTEVYAALAGDGADGERLLRGFLETRQGIQPSRLDGHLYSFRDGAVAHHLMEVASGLDSMMLGEYQILSQIKAAYAGAREAKTTGSLLNKLFESALAAGKRVRTETEISRGAFSVGAAAVEYATHIFGDDLKNNTVLILGAGKMSELTARHLQARGARSVFVTNRTYQRAAELAAQLTDARARRFDELPQVLTEADIVISSTAAPHPVVTRSLIQEAMRRRRNRPLYIVDIAVPRDVETSVGEIDNVYLNNIDDLQQLVARAQGGRAAEVAKALVIIGESVSAFAAWRQSLEVTPLIRAVRSRLDDLRTEELARLRARVPQLGAAEMQAVEQAFQSYSGKIAHRAITAIKDCAGKGDPESAERLAAIRSAFGIDTPPDEPLESARPAYQLSPASESQLREAYGK